MANYSTKITTVVNEEREAQNTLMLLMLGEPPKAPHPNNIANHPHHVWRLDAHQWLKERGIEGGTTRARIIDDFIIWLGENAATRVMESIDGRR